MKEERNDRMKVETDDSTSLRRATASGRRRFLKLSSAAGVATALSRPDFKAAEEFRVGSKDYCCPTGQFCNEATETIDISGVETTLRNSIANNVKGDLNKAALLPAPTEFRKWVLDSFTLTIPVPGTPAQPDLDDNINIDIRRCVTAVNNRSGGSCTATAPVMTPTSTHDQLNVTISGTLNYKEVFLDDGTDTGETGTASYSVTVDLEYSLVGVGGAAVKPGFGSWPCPEITDDNMSCLVLARVEREFEVHISGTANHAGFDVVDGNNNVIFTVPANTVTLGPAANIGKKDYEVMASDPCRPSAGE